MLAKATISSLALKADVYFRLKMSDWRGDAWFPSLYETASISTPVPRTFTGFCTIQFFDKFGRETRSVVARLEASKSSAAAFVSPGSSQKSAVVPPGLIVGAEAYSGAGSGGDSEDEAEDEAEADEADEADSEGDSETSADVDGDGDGGDVDVDGDDPDPVYQANLRALKDNSKGEAELSRALIDATIQRTNLESRALASRSEEGERDREMRYERARAGLILSHSYTKEVAENHQVSNLLRRDLVALAASLRAELQNRVADSDRRVSESDRQIRMNTRLAMDLGKMIREQAAAAPVPPPPPLDVAGLGIALIQAVGQIGAAWGPNRPQLPPAQTPAATPAAPAPPNADALTKEAADKAAEEEKELREAIFVAETTGGGDAASLIKLINRLAAKANLIAPGQK